MLPLTSGAVLVERLAGDGDGVGRLEGGIGPRRGVDAREFGLLYLSLFDLSTTILGSFFNIIVVNFPSRPRGVVGREPL